MEQPGQATGDLGRKVTPPEAPGGCRDSPPSVSPMGAGAADRPQLKRVRAGMGWTE